jgi:hypothetical protein
MWIWIARWMKRESNIVDATRDAENVYKHWREVALDVGLDPDANVTKEESATQIRVGISKGFNQYIADEMGDWDVHGTGTAP